MAVLDRALERFIDFMWEPPAHKPAPGPARLTLPEGKGTELRWFCESCRDQSGGFPVGRSEPPPGLGDGWAIDYCSECDRNHALPETLAMHVLINAGYDIEGLPSWSQSGTVFWDGRYIAFAEWARRNIPSVS